MLCFPIGAVGGALCAFVILSFGALVGRSGTTGCEYIGYWDSAYWGISCIYGGAFGFIGLPIAFLISMRDFSTCALIAESWKIAGTTILAGCIAAFAGPPFAALIAIAAFFTASAYTKHKIQNA